MAFGKSRRFVKIKNCVALPNINNRIKICTTIIYVKIYDKIIIIDTNGEEERVLVHSTGKVSALHQVPIRYKFQILAYPQEDMII